MAKKYKLEVGQIYAIPLSDGNFTIAQLYNHHIINTRSSEDTFAFFNYKYYDIEALKLKLFELSLDTPFSIATINGHPIDYDWILVSLRDIMIGQNYKANFNSLGMYNNISTDPSIFLEPYFGLFPWDGYYKDDYLDEFLVPNAEMRDDIKYLKDYTIEQLKELLPPNSPKLIQLLKDEEKNK